jgi:thymidylate kinase
MIVILEGVDGSGKTTLCNQLVQQGYKKVEIESGNYEFDNWREAKINSRDDVVICDRSFITDLVYRTFDNQQRRGMNLQQMCGTLWNDVIVIHLESGSEFDDAMKRGEDNITDVISHTRIKFLYKDIINMLKIFVGVPVKTYNWRRDNLADVISFIEKGGRCYG